MVDELNLDLVPAVESVGTRAVAYFRSSLDDEGDRLKCNVILFGGGRRRMGCGLFGSFVTRGRRRRRSRPGLVEMMEEWIARRDDFDAVICFDRSRLGRLVDDGGAELAAVCEENGKTMLID